MAQAYRAGSVLRHSEQGTDFDTVIDPTGKGWAEGDIIIGLCSSGQSNTAYTFPTGWTTLIANQRSGLCASAVGWIAVPAGGLSTAQKTFAVATAGTARYADIYLAAFTGCHTTTPIVASANGTFVSNAPSTTDCDPPAIAAGTDSLLVCGAVRVSSSGFGTGAITQSGYTVFTTADNSWSVLSYSNSLLSGAQDPPVITGQPSGTETIWHGFTLGLAVAAAAGTAALTGTATASITEADIVSGNKTLIITLTGDTWVSN